MHFIITYFSDTNKISWKLKMKAIKDAFDNQNLALARKLANEVIELSSSYKKPAF